MRTLAFLQRRPDLERETFREHYEERHVPLALPQLRGLRHYVRNHVLVESDAGAPPFDTISEFEYESSDAFDAMLEMLASSEGAAIREDELRFMHKPGNSFFASALASTGPGARPTPGPGSDCKVMAALRCADNEKREALAARAYNAAASIERSGAANASQIDVALAGDPLGPAVFDVVLHLWYPQGTDLRVAVEALRSTLAGASVVHCFGVLECATRIDDATNSPTAAEQEPPR